MGIQERKNREKERRRQQIIIAAKKIFSSKGFHKTTMEDIAKKAELSPGTLYLYFKNKDELFASLSMRLLHYLSIRINNIDIEAELNSKQRMEILKDAFLDVYIVFGVDPFPKSKTHCGGLSGSSFSIVTVFMIWFSFIPFSTYSQNGNHLYCPRNRHEKGLWMD